MPEGWTLKRKLVRSRKFRQLYQNSPLCPQLVYCLMTACKDSWGLVPADPVSLKAQLGPFDPHHDPDEYEEAVRELQRVGLVKIFTHQGDPWAYMVGHEREHAAKCRRGKSASIPIPHSVMYGEYQQTESVRTQTESTRMQTESVRTQTESVRTQTESTRMQTAPMERERELEREGEYVRSDVAETATSHPLPPYPQKSHTNAKSDTQSQISKMKAGAEDVATPDESSTPPPGLEPARGAPARAHPDQGGESPRSGPGPEPAPSRPAAHQVPGGCPPAQQASVGPSPTRDVLGAALGPAMIRDSRPIGPEQDRLLEVAQYHAEVWHLDVPEILPSGDLRRRILQVLDHPTLGAKWREDILGHHAEASRDGSQRNQGLRGAFPEARNGGRRQSHRVDLDQVQEFIQIAHSKCLGARRHRREDQTRVEAYGYTWTATEAVQVARRWESGDLRGDSDWVDQEAALQKAIESRPDWPWPDKAKKSLTISNRQGEPP